MADDTIFALSSGSLPSGVAVVRVSGPATGTVIEKIIHRSLPDRKAVLCNFVNPEDQVIVDEGLAIFFPGPNSFTGEDVLELHCHGGVATVAAMLSALNSIPGLRSAEAGEFSRRAFENGRMDLTALEGLADLVAAQTESQRRLALQQAGGSLQKLYDNWRSELIRSRALIEAELDFSDEDDVPGSVSQMVWSKVEKLHDEMRHHLADEGTGELIRNGFGVALLGPPNAGKSSLLNALAKRDVAIVTPQAGTTRDVIEVSLNVDSHLVVVMDTAGVREAADLVEKEGIRRALLAAESADLSLWLQPVDDIQSPPENLNCILVRTKSDLCTGNDDIDDPIVIHTRSEKGIAPLLAFLSKEIRKRRRVDEEPLLTRQRHREALEATSMNLLAALEPLEIELRSEHLRRAADCLGKITGRIDVEDLLDVIFSEFCIGK